MQQEQRIRQEVEGRLGRPLPDHRWDFLVKHGFVGDGAGDLAYLVGVVQDLLRADSQPRTADREPDPKRKHSGHAWARSVLVAEVAREDPEVKAYRSDVLGDRLVSREDVPKWVEEQVDNELPVRWAALAVTDAPSMSTEEISGRPTSWSKRILRYQVPGEEWVRLVPTGQGPLERLRKLSESLADFCGWTEDQAVVFVLTDVVPWVPPIRVTTPGLKVRYDVVCTWGRIQLDIDPSVPADEVAAAYKKVRNSKRRPRRVSEKHARLAIFRIENEQLPWGDLLTRWNEEYPDWRYSHQSNFRRDVSTAERRALGVLDTADEDWI